MSWVDEKLGLKAGLWYHGTTFPAPGVGKDGDFFAIIGGGAGTGDILLKQNGSWNVIGSMTGGGGDPVPRVVNVLTSGNKTFNGDGTGGAVQIYPLTILFTGQDGDAIYNFDDAGVEEGWMVLFDIEGTDATLEIQNQGDMILELDIDSNTQQATGIYFDGDDWRPLQIRFQVS